MLLRTQDYAVLCKPPDVRMDGLHDSVTMDTLARAWLPDATVKLSLIHISEPTRPY